jgi:LacI family transcriptional regulator
VSRVLRAHNYTTGRSARARTVGRTGLVGFTLPFVRGDYFTSILAGATEALYEREIRVVLCPTRHEHDREVTLLELLMNGTTDGAIILLPEESNDELTALQAHGFPFVVADPRHRLDEGIPAVSAANSAGARAATEYLLQLGHRRIGHVTGVPGFVASDERMSGYQIALARAGLPQSAELVAVGNFEIDGGHEAAAVLLDLPDRPTAIFAANDNLAVGVLQAARERGLEVPRDLSVVGFDDLSQATIATPALTTVRQPLEELGRLAVSLLLRIIDRQRVEAVRVELATRLIVRESTAPPPA